MATAAAAPAVVRVEARRFPGSWQRTAAKVPPGDPLGLADASLGSGVIIDKDRGFVVTNNHVVKDADEIVVRLSKGNRMSARLWVRSQDGPRRAPDQREGGHRRGLGRFRQARHR